MNKVVLCAIFVILITALGFGQIREHINFSAGGGFTVPTDRAGNALNHGWNIDFRGGVNVTKHLSADLDFAYSNMRFNDATLARFAEPNGGIGIWSLTFNPVVRLAPAHSKIQPYVTAGYGLYHMNFTLTAPATVPGIFCDPFFGFCFPTTVGVDQVVASNSTYKGGFNAGGGFDIPLGQSKVKLFTEARYHRMFTTHNSDLTYIPVTFGLRW